MKFSCAILCFNVCHNVYRIAWVYPVEGGLGLSLAHLGQMPIGPREMTPWAEAKGSLA